MCINVSPRTHACFASIASKSSRRVSIHDVQRERLFALSRDQYDSIIIRRRYSCSLFSSSSPGEKRRKSVVLYENSDDFVRCVKGLLYQEYVICRYTTFKNSSQRFPKNRGCQEQLY